MFSILTAAYEMGGCTGWTVIWALAIVPAMTAVGCLGLMLFPVKGPR